MNRDEITGKAEALGGRIKQAVGDLTNDPGLRQKGVAEEAAGEAKVAVGEVKRTVGRALTLVEKAINE